MSKNIMVLLIVVAVIFLGGGAFFYRDKVRELFFQDQKSVQVIVYERGEKSVNPARSQEIIEAATELIEEADEILELMVTNETISEIKENEKAVEIVFSREQKLRIVSKNQEISFKKILIPLSGEFGGGEAIPELVIFFGTETYGAGPLLTHNKEKIQVLYGIFSK